MYLRSSAKYDICLACDEPKCRSVRWGKNTTIGAMATAARTAGWIIGGHDWCPDHTGKKQLSDIISGGDLSRRREEIIKFHPLTGDMT